MAKLVKVVAILTAKRGMSGALATLLAEMIAPSREPGNLDCELWQDRNDPARFVLDELYLDDIAVTAYRKTTHYTNYIARIGELAERQVMVLIPGGRSL